MLYNKKTFFIGLFLLLSFTGIMVAIVSPIFGNGRNGLEYADDMFNSLAKGSAYFIPEEVQKAEKVAGTSIDVKIKASDSQEATNWAKLYNTAGANATVSGTEVKIQGDMGAIARSVLADSESMYQNRGSEVSGRYGIDAREATYGWYNSLKKVTKELDKQEKFSTSAYITNMMQKSVEPAYNYYGIEIKHIADYSLIVFALLAFYLFYTLYYGFAFYFLFDGVGITMTKQAKKAEA